MNNLALLWFKGISMDTLVRDVGWTYVFIGVMLVVLTCLIVSLWKDFR